MEVATTASHATSSTPPSASASGVGRNGAGMRLWTSQPSKYIAINTSGGGIRTPALSTGWSERASEASLATIGHMILSELEKPLYVRCQQRAHSHVCPPIHLPPSYLALGPEAMK